MVKLDVIEMGCALNSFLAQEMTADVVKIQHFLVRVPSLLVFGAGLPQMCF